MPIKSLLNDVDIEEAKITINFAEVSTNGDVEIIPVEKPHGASDKEYIRYNGEPQQALLKIAQDKGLHSYWYGIEYQTPIKFILEHPNNKILKTKDFLEFLTSPNSEGQLPIHSITRKSLVEVVRLAKEHHITIDFHAIDPNTNETLFSKFAGTGLLELTQEILANDPLVICQSQDQKESFFTRAALIGAEEEATLLLQAMQDAKMELSPADQWIKKAFLNETGLEKSEFSTLPKDLQHKVYQVANVHARFDFLHKLEDCDIHEPSKPPRGPALFSYNMNALDVRNTLHEYLINLRKNGLLLTKEEFSRKDQRQFYKKNVLIDRMLGRDYLQRTIDHLELKHIKVPQKLVAIDHLLEEKEKLKFEISNKGDMNIVCRQLTVYPEKIQRISPKFVFSELTEPGERCATKEEMTELLNVIEATGFNDLLGDNFFLGRNLAGETGIYFIDTERRNFSVFPSETYRALCNSDNVGRLCQLMEPKDHQWLREEITRRCEAFEKERESKTSCLESEFEKECPFFIENGFMFRTKPFLVDIANLVVQPILQHKFSDASISSSYWKQAGYAILTLGSTLLGIEAILTTSNKQITGILNGVSFDGQLALGVIMLAFSACLIAGTLHLNRNKQADEEACLLGIKCC